MPSSARTGGVPRWCLVTHQFEHRRFVVHSSSSSLALVVSLATAVTDDDAEAALRGR
jgi:hypothetical protein